MMRFVVCADEKTSIASVAISLKAHRPYRFHEYSTHLSLRMSSKIRISRSMMLRS